MSSDLAGYLAHVCSYLKENKFINELEGYLKYFAENGYHNNRIFEVKAIPRLNSVDDLITFKEYLNKLAIDKNIEGLKRSMELGRLQRIFHQNESKTIHIHVKVKRKSMINFCYGNECFVQGKRYPPSMLFTLKCCSFHSYCRPCLYQYVISSLRKNPTGNMPCEGCCLVGTINTSNPIKTITPNEIDQLIPRDERIKYFEETHRRNFLGKCESRLHFCPNKDEYIEKSNIVTFDCGDRLCLDCDAISTIYYIFEITNCITNNPQNFSNYEPVGIMCPNRHIETLKKLTLEQLKDKLNGRKIQKEIVAQAIHLYQENFQYFSEKSFVYCSNCNKLFQRNIERNSCKECKKCFECNNDEHPGLTCDAYRSMLYNVASLGLLKSGHDKEDRMLLKLSEIFDQSGLKNYKISSYMMIEPPKLMKYLNDKIKQSYPNAKSSYVFGAIYTTDKEAKTAVFQGVPDSNIPGIYIFHKNFSSDGGFLIVYRITFISNPVNRTPNEGDAKNPYCLYLSSNLAYLTSKESALPFALVQFTKLN